jgi:hypothetical protein
MRVALDGRARFTLVQLVLDVMKREAPAPVAREIPLLSWILLAPLLVLLGGPLIALPTFAFLDLKLRSGEGWKPSLTITLGIAALLYLLLRLTMPTRLYGGLPLFWR